MIWINLLIISIRIKTLKWTEEICSKPVSWNRINKKIQTDGKLEIKSLGIQIETLETRLTHTMKNMEDRITGTKNKTGYMDTSVKENAKSKRIQTFKKCGNQWKDQIFG